MSEAMDKSHSIPLAFFVFVPLQFSDFFAVMFLLVHINYIQWVSL